jgi:hypothetical protein
VGAFGAKCDGSTDDSAAIETAIRYGQTNAVAIAFPSANCVLASAIGGNGLGSVSLIFNATTLTQKHTGVAITLSQGSFSAPVVIYGDVTFKTTASAAATAALSVSFPSASSIDTPNFDVYGKINCISSQSTVTSPYPGTYTNCLTVAGVWQPYIGGLQYTGPVTGGLPLAGTSALLINGSGYASVSTT